MVLLRSVIGQENSHHPLSQPDGKVRPIATSSLALQAVSQFEFSLVNDDDYLG